MTISATTNRMDYTGNGATATYSYTFKIFSKNDLKVTKRDNSNVETLLVVDTDYTVTGVGNSAGGSITLTAGNLTSGYKLTIRRARALKQETDIRNQGDFYPEVHEDALDNGVMIDLTQQEEIDRALKLPETVTGVSPILPIPVAKRILRFSSDAMSIEAVDAATLPSSVVTIGKGLQLVGSDLSSLNPYPGETDLRDYLPSGYVTDGTVDYSTEIQACISAGKRIFIPAGTWLCENLNVRGYRNIRGAGRGNTVLKIPAASTSWLINSSDGATGDWLPYSSITDLSIDGNSSTTALGGIYAEFITQWNFERITMYGFFNTAAVGLKLNHAYQIAIRDCYIRMGSAGAGKKGEACFKIGATTADAVHTSHITYDNCLAQYSGTGFLFDDMGNRGGNMTVRQCAAGNHDYGVRIKDFYREMLIENSLIENTSINGVRVTTATAYNIHNISLRELTMYENTIAVYADQVDGLGMDKLRFVGDDAGGHTAFSLASIKRLELGTYNVEGTAYDTIVAASTIDPRLPNLNLNDNSPDVFLGGKRQAFKTQSTVPTTISAFDNGVIGQEITVIFADANTTIDFTGTNLKGNAGADFVGAVGDVMTGVFDGTNWCFQVHDNTP